MIHVCQAGEEGARWDGSSSTVLSQHGNESAGQHEAESVKP